MNLIEELERAQAAKLAALREIPEFQPGDTVIVNVKVKEGERTRVQAYEGVCIGRSGGGLNESFTVRKISYGEGVERVFPIYSPMIDSIKVVRRGKVRRAKLYYLRDRRGKSARIAEKMEGHAPKAVPETETPRLPSRPRPSPPRGKQSRPRKQSLQRSRRRRPNRKPGPPSRRKRPRRKRNLPARKQNPPRRKQSLPRLSRPRRKQSRPRSPSPKA